LHVASNMMQNARVHTTVKPIAAQTDHLQRRLKVPFTIRRKKSRMEILTKQVPLRKMSWPSQALCGLLMPCLRTRVSFGLTKATV
jgi:hypothetical protein